MSAEVIQASVNQNASDGPGLSLPFTLRLEWMAYAGLALLALILRLVSLGLDPPSDYEAAQMLHAWHLIEDDAPGSYVTSHNPLTHLTQLFGFTLLGATEFSARIGVALAGVALALTPLLFRQTIGVTRTFIWSLLLAILTLPVASARTADGATFMMLFVVLATWMIRRYWYSERTSHAIAAAILVSAMLLLSGPSGLPLLLILLLSGLMALWRTALSAPERLDLPGDDILRLSLRRFQTLPFARIVAASLLFVALTSTLFMLYPGGMRTIGALVGAALGGFTQPIDASGTRSGLITILTREPLLIIFALGGAWLIWRHGAVTFLDRFAAAWSVVALLGLALYPGARAADAMWVALPLSLLASYGITQLMVNRRVASLWNDDPDESASHELYTTRYWSVKWLISLGVLLLLLTASTQFLQVARALADVPADVTPPQLLAGLLSGDYPRLAQALGLLLMSAIVSLIVAIILANLWGSATSLQGIGLGCFWILLLSALGGGWSLTTLGARDPAEPWRSAAIDQDAHLLRETLNDLAQRRNKGFPLLVLHVVTEPETFVNDAGLLAWLLRDYPNARFAPAAPGEAIVIMAEGAEANRDMRGDYVGQRFVLRRHVSLADLSLWQLPAWWTQRRIKGVEIEESAVILWLRQDVYDGVES